MARVHEVEVFFRRFMEAIVNRRNASCCAASRIKPRSERSSSTASQWIPMPPPINCHFFNCDSVAFCKRSKSEIRACKISPLFSTTASRSSSLYGCTSTMRNPSRRISVSIGSMPFPNLTVEVVVPRLQDFILPLPTIADLLVSILGQCSQYVGIN